MHDAPDLLRNGSKCYTFNLWTTKHSVKHILLSSNRPHLIGDMTHAIHQIIVITLPRVNICLTLQMRHYSICIQQMCDVGFCDREQMCRTQTCVIMPCQILRLDSGGVPPSQAPIQLPVKIPSSLLAQTRNATQMVASRAPWHGRQFEV